MKRGEGAHPVEHLMVCFQGVSLSLSLYAGDDPAGRKAQDGLRMAFGPVWSLGPQLSLRVSGKGVSWKGKLIPGSGKGAGIGRKWHKAGLETIEFTPGVEAAEVIRFLEVLHQAEALGPEDEDDLATLLWQEDFQHLHYTTVDQSPAPERPLPSKSGRTPSPAAKAVRDQVRDEVAEEKRQPKVVRIEEFDSTLYFLDPAEVDYLTDAIEKEYAQDHAINVVNLLLDTLELQTDEATREEVISTLEELLPHLLASRNFKASGYLVTHLKDVRSSVTDLTKAQAEALDEIAAGLSSPEALGQLFHTLQDEDELPTEQDLAELLAHLSPDALGTLLIWLHRLSAEEGRAILGAALMKNFEAKPEALTKALESDDPGVVLRALELVRRVRLEPSSGTLSKLAAHSEAGVRGAVVPILAMTRESSTLRHLARMAADPEEDVRVAALRALASRPFKGAVAPLEESIGAADLEERDLGEKRILFETYGKLAGPSGVPLLSSLLQGRKGFGKKGPSSDTRACAALALGKIGTPPARKLLEKALRDRDPVVRNAALRAIK